MLTFTINTDNAIDAFLNGDAATSQGEDAVYFGNQEQLGIVTAGWPLSRLATIHNEAAGVPPFGSIRPVTKFESRVVAVSRLWQMARTLANGMRVQEAEAPEPMKLDVPLCTETTEPEAQGAEVPVEAGTTKAKKPAAPPAKPRGPRKAKREPEATPKAETNETKAPKAGTKRDRAIAMLNRKNGASNQELQDEFGWQPHSCRGFLATLKTKMGLNVESFKTEAGERRYKVNS